MRISVLTIFPEQFSGFMNEPVIRRALEKNIVSIEIVDIKEYAGGSFRHIDDSPFGGGPGMVMRCAPVFAALETVRTEESCTVVLSPAGYRYTQQTAHSFSGIPHLILICGHYEGIDERVVEAADTVCSIGDYVLTGGELPAKVIMDSVIRLLPGVLRAESTVEESFENGLLEHPQYTQPAVYREKSVPPVLLSGNHEAIRRFREEESLRITKERRPDLLSR